MLDDLIRFDVALEIRNSEQRKPWRSGLYSKTLVKNENLRVVLISMEPGATLKEHHAGGPITVHVLYGWIRFYAGAQQHALRAGQILVLGGAIKHAVESMGHSALLLTLSLPGVANLGQR